MKRIPSTLIIALITIAPAFASDCYHWSTDDGKYHLCVNDALVASGRTAVPVDDLGLYLDVKNPGILYLPPDRTVDDYFNGNGDGIISESASPVPHDCKRDDQGGCVDPNPN